MATKSKVPTITAQQFDAFEAPLREALKAWWAGEAQTFDAAVAGTASVWEGMPEIDSKAVVKASPIIRQFLGCDLDPKLIRRGGYSSFDDLANDLIPKLRSSCSSMATPLPEAIDSEMESINVRSS